METRSRDSITTDGRSILLDLRHEQDAHPRDSNEWREIRGQIDIIVAQQYLEYLNR